MTVRRFLLVEIDVQLIPCVTKGVLNLFGLAQVKSFYILVDYQSRSSIHSYKCSSEETLVQKGVLQAWKIKPSDLWCELDWALFGPKCWFGFG